MHRQKFDCTGIPVHLFRDRFKLWLDDIKVSRQFMAEEGAEEYFVVGQNAYSYLLSLNDDSYVSVKAGSVGSPCELDGIRVVSSIFQQHEHKDSHDVLPNEIEYRLINP